MKINVLMIGSGKMAEAYIKVIKSFNNFNILGVFSRNKKNLENFCKINKVNMYESYSDINKEKDKIDLLIIAVSAPNLIKVIKHTKHLNCVRLLEKPLGINMSEAKQIQKLCNKKKYFMALNRRTYESTIFAKKKLNKKKKIILIEDHINFESLEQLGFKKHQYKNFIYSHSIHLVDYLNIFSKGKILEIKKYKFKINKNTYLYCFINFSSGDIAIYTSLYNSKKKWKVTIFDKNRIIKLQPLENAIIKTKNYIKKFTPLNRDKHFKPGLFRIISNLNLFFKKKNYELVDINEAFKVMNLINKLHF